MLKNINKNIKVHKAFRYGLPHYIFTKDEKTCIAVVYNERHNYVWTANSGVHEIEIFITEEMEEISFDEVPAGVIDLLTFLSE